MTAAATAAKATATAATATASKANDADDNGGGSKSDSNSDGSGGGGGGGGGSGDNGDDGDNVDDDDGDDDCLACDNQIDGGRRGPPAPRGQTAAALSSPSSQAPSANVNAPKQATLNSTYAHGGTTAQSASSSLVATVVPDATSTAAADADGNAENILCKT
jgi:hypothetical protein